MALCDQPSSPRRNQLLLPPRLLLLSLLLLLHRSRTAAAFASDSFIQRGNAPAGAAACASARRHSPYRTQTRHEGTVSYSYSYSAMAAKVRGLEQQPESATPQPGGMTLYCKAGPDGPDSLGDCPFAHWVRLVLEEKGLEYELRPATADTKPAWLVKFYNGQMPALRHRKECYVESGVICDYLDFFFPEPPLQTPRAAASRAAPAEAAADGLFPALAGYLKHTPDGDADDQALRDTLRGKLQALEDVLAVNAADSIGPYLVGPQPTLLDLSLAPKLYHLTVGLAAFKSDSADWNIARDYPLLQTYMDVLFARESFQRTVYPKETVVWGWGNARSK